MTIDKYEKNKFSRLFTPRAAAFFHAVFLYALCRNVKYLSSHIIPLHRMI